MGSQITSLTIVYPTVYSGADQRKQQRSRVPDLCEGNSPVTGEFPAQRASNAENVPMWWRYIYIYDSYMIGLGTTVGYDCGAEQLARQTVLFMDRIAAANTNL